MTPSYFPLGCHDFSNSFAVTCRFSWPLFVGSPAPRTPVPSSSDSTCFSLRGWHQPLDFCPSNGHGGSSPQILKKFLPEHTPATSPHKKLIVPNAYPHIVLPDNSPTSGDGIVIPPHAQGSSLKLRLKQCNEARKAADWGTLGARFESLRCYSGAIESLEISKPISLTTK